MSQKPSLRVLFLFAAALCAAVQTYGDVVETRDGARLVGKVTRIDEGSVSIETSFAGVLAIKQSEIASITTDAPFSVRLSSGTRVDGRVSAAPGGGLQIAAAEGLISTSVAGLDSGWAAGGRDPLERSWDYEAAVDVTGKTGNKEQLGTAASLRATLKTRQDMLQFYSAYDRQVVDGLKSADQFKAGVDYQNNFSGRKSWYVRDEGGFDRVKDIELYNIAAAGFGFDVIKEPKHLLTTRAGLSFRYEGYRNPATEDVKGAGLDLGLSHDYTMANSRIVNRISFVPTFEDFGNYRLTHESFYEMPLGVPSWKLRLGVSNDYNSEPGAGVEKLDTSYFTRFVLSWK
jgi:hypothetical protein